ncbi:MAG: LLM class flavin-dependent oxidoreductase [Anaerolineaceae bacterium]|nr:LLM class flavin-dependent oxidoreductase [Anaerolineaceae bacterium]
MRYGLVLPSWEARPVAKLARAAENAGWDGVFLWEPVWGFDAWMLLAAAATLTERIRLGTMITPLSRMRPWKLASETLTLDHLSNGRVILSVGLGALDTGFEEFGEVTDRKARAELLDEGLEILTGLWRGKPFHFDGKHYTLRESSFPAPPPTVQQPRIPIWVVGAWPREKSIQRALRYDGLLPNQMNPGGPAGRPEVEDIRAMRAYVDARRSGQEPYDIIVEGVTPGNPQESIAVVRPWAQAGATWWIEADWNALNGSDPVASTRRRILQGPPMIE